MSTIPKNKQTLYTAVESAFDKILLDYISIPDTYSRKLGVEGNIKHSVISVSDTLAYLIGWGDLVLGWYQKTSAGETVNFPATGYKWNELGSLAESFHLQYKDWLYDDLIAKFKDTVNQLLLLIDSLTDEELHGHVWYEKYTLGRMIQFNTSSPMKNMRTKVRRFKKINNI